MPASSTLGNDPVYQLTANFQNRMGLFETIVDATSY